MTKATAHVYVKSHWDQRGRHRAKDRRKNALDMCI